MFQFVVGRLSKESYNIKITIYGDLITSAEENQSYSFTKLRISQFNSERILETTEFSSIKPLENAIEVNNEDLVTSKKQIVGHISKVHLKIFNDKYLCTSCKSEQLEKVESDATVAICQNCEKLVILQDCRQKSGVGFSVTAGVEIIDLICDLSILEKCFEESDKIFQFISKS